MQLFLESNFCIGSMKQELVCPMGEALHIVLPKLHFLVLVCTLVLKR